MAIPDGEGTGGKVSSVSGEDAGRDEETLLASEDLDGAEDDELTLGGATAEEDDESDEDGWDGKKPPPKRRWDERTNQLRAARAREGKLRNELDALKARTTVAEEIEKVYQGFKDPINQAREDRAAMDLIEKKAKEARFQPLVREVNEALRAAGMESEPEPKSDPKLGALQRKVLGKEVESFLTDPERGNVRGEYRKLMRNAMMAQIDPGEAEGLSDERLLEAATAALRENGLTAKKVQNARTRPRRPSAPGTGGHATQRTRSADDEEPAQRRSETQRPSRRSWEEDTDKIISRHFA